MDIWLKSHGRCNRGFSLDTLRNRAAASPNDYFYNDSFSYLGFRCFLFSAHGENFCRCGVGGDIDFDTRIYFKIKRFWKHIFLCLPIPRRLSFGAWWWNWNDVCSYAILSGDFEEAECLLLAG